MSNYVKPPRMETRTLKSGLARPTCTASGVEKGINLKAALDYAQAFKWFTRAAEQGEPRSYFHLGTLYETGWECPQNYARAATWYTRAAEIGIMGAQASLGRLYHHGRGVPRDYAQAVKWYTRAAELGDLDSQFNLASLHLTGQGTPQDFIKAHAWFNLAAAQFQELPKDSPLAARPRRAAMLRDELGARMTPHQLSQAQQLATEIQERAKRIWKPRDFR